MKTIKKENCDVTMPFYEIRISVTGACNQNCVYCGPFTDGKHDKGYENLSLGQVEEIFSRLKGIIGKLNIHIQITGGEPMLRHDLQEIVQIIRSHGIKDIGITTNGSLITPEVSLRLIKSGLSDFHIHIPSLDREAYSKTTGKIIEDYKIKNILDSVRSIKEGGARVEFNTPITQINISTIKDLLQFCYVNKINLKLIEELTLDNTQVKVEVIKNIVNQWIKNKNINIGESRINNRYGLIYQFEEGFFFRIAPVSLEFRNSLMVNGGRILLDGRYWIGGRAGRLLFTPSYFLDPKEGTIEDLKKQIENVIEIYNSRVL